MHGGQSNSYLNIGRKVGFSGLGSVSLSWYPDTLPTELRGAVEGGSHWCPMSVLRDKPMTYTTKLPYIGKLTGSFHR